MEYGLFTMPSHPPKPHPRPEWAKSAVATSTTKVQYPLGVRVREHRGRRALHNNHPARSLK